MAWSGPCEIWPDIARLWLTWCRTYQWMSYQGIVRFDLILSGGLAWYYQIMWSWPKPTRYGTPAWPDQGIVTFYLILTESGSVSVEPVYDHTRVFCTQWYMAWCLNIPARPLHNHDIVSVHFNHFYCTEICDKLGKDLAMFTYIYLNMDECWLTSSMPQQRFKFQILLTYAVIPENVFSED